ncbi:MAG TPA: DUF1501 domain-containing protein [Longimicrobiales bacterium]|nr:DUF1501 domain-containing protein [Longimicrobiales bacterium]
MINRRVFLKSGGLALLALGAPPEFVTRALLAETRGAARKKTLVCIFQRGAVDGLSMVVPFGEKEYYRRRSSIAIAAPGRLGGEGSAIDLDGFFGLNPALRPLHDLFRRRELAIVHAVGSPDATRSHFDAQDYMERAAPGDRQVRDGWLNRVLGETSSGCAECDGRTLKNPALHAADHRVGQTKMAEYPAQAALRGVAIGAELPVSLRGAHPSLAIADLDRFGVAGGRDPSLEGAFASLYHTEEGDAVSGAAGEAFEAIRILKSANPAQYRPAAGVDYPPGELGRQLRQIAQLIKADVGVEIAFASVGGWDTHFAQGGAGGQLARRLGELAQGLGAFHDDLGDRMADVAVLTMSEFGRTVAENGSGGTDHGHANCMLVLGGEVRGGRILGEWPGLAPERLYEARDLAVTTDFRDVFAELAGRHLGAGHLDRVFPGYAVEPKRWRGVLG